MNRLGIVYYISPTAPFKLDLTVWALRRRKENSYDRWDDGVYKRILVVHGNPTLVHIKQIAPARRPKLEVVLKGSGALDLEATIGIIERTLGLKTNLAGFYRRIAKDEKLGSIFKRFMGLKPPRFPSLYEAIVNGICCQQLSLTVGIILLSRLSQKYGLGVKSDDQRAFPEPDSIAKSSIQELRGLGLSGQKARALIALSKELLAKPVGYKDLEKLDGESVITHLTGYFGVGRWTAEYVLLRGLGRLESFPGDDIGARNNLKARLGISGPLSYQDVKAIVSRWHPYEGFVYFHFVLEKLRERGFVDVPNPTVAAAFDE
jgi:DNA-3-methyladenine glycosylase II